MDRVLLHEVECHNEGCVEHGIAKQVYGEVNGDGLLVVPDVRCPSCRTRPGPVHLDCCGATSDGTLPADDTGT